ncbi:MAG: hypothetical protein G8345_19230 [Magnetococcales bacterium]|nr:hypothetical protein [Magnetococcales bacterium]
MQFLRNNKLFLTTVVLTTLLSVVYFGFVASDVYISESRFVVRTPDRQNFSTLGMIIKGMTGFSRSQDDSYTVQDFILSRDALNSLENVLLIKKAFSNPDIDRVSRFAGLDLDNSHENFHRYYKRMVDVDLDPISSISTLTTRAFNAEDAYNMNMHLLELGEKLVNQLNERGRQDMIRFALQEVRDAENQAKEASIALARYRDEKEVIDPEKQSAIPLQLISKLQEEFIATQTQVQQLEKVATTNPQLEVLRQRAKFLKKQIQQESQRVVGNSGTSLASKTVEYERLLLEKDFSDKMVASAMNTLEQARNEAHRKQLYLERIVHPNKPDVAMEPKRLRAIAAVFALSLMVWGILSMLVAGIREHQD